MEALDGVRGHRAKLTGDLGDVLNETDHSLRAFRVEFVIITSLNLVKLTNTISLGGGKRVFGNSWLKIVSQIRHEPHSIVQLNVESLIINSSPVTLDQLSLAVGGTLIILDGLSVLAQHSFGLEIVK